MLSLHKRGNFCQMMGEKSGEKTTIFTVGCFPGAPLNINDFIRCSGSLKARLNFYWCALYELMAIFRRAAIPGSLIKALSENYGLLRSEFYLSSILNV